MLNNCVKRIYYNLILLISSSCFNRRFRYKNGRFYINIGLNIVFY